MCGYGSQCCAFVTCLLLLPFLLHTRAEIQARTTTQVVIAANGLNDARIPGDQPGPTNNRGKGGDKEIQPSEKTHLNTETLSARNEFTERVVMKVREEAETGDVELGDRKLESMENVLKARAPRGGARGQPDVGRPERDLKPLLTTSVPLVQAKGTPPEDFMAYVSELRSRELYGKPLQVDGDKKRLRLDVIQTRLPQREVFEPIDTNFGGVKNMDYDHQDIHVESEKENVIKKAMKKKKETGEIGKEHSDFNYRAGEFQTDEKMKMVSRLHRRQRLRYTANYLPRSEQRHLLRYRPPGYKHRHIIYHNSTSGTAVTDTGAPSTRPPGYRGSSHHRMPRQVKEEEQQQHQQQQHQQYDLHNNKNIRARKEGDVIIGALFPLHQAPTQKTAYTRQCGDVREYYGIQRVEAFLMTLEKINNDTSILPHIKLGWDIRDSCWYSAIALENSIDFIKDAIASQSATSGNSNQGDAVSNNDIATNTSSSPSSSYPLSASSNLSSSPSSSSPKSSKNISCKSEKHMRPIAGLVGPGSSEASIQVQNLLQIFNIPQIGYSATTIDLSDKSHYKYFLRVVPPDRHQAQALVDVVVRFNWTYISTVHSDGNYGVRGMEKFTDLATERGVCIAASDNVASSAEDEAFDKVLDKLTVPNATVVVCFCEGLTVKKLLQATRRRGMEGRFLIVGSDGWGNRQDVVKGHETAALGAISIKLYSPPLTDFGAHYATLRPYTRNENPWFHMFWQQKFKCSLDPRKRDLRGFSRFCSGNESLSGSDEDSKLGFVVNAVQTMARALHAMHKDLCPGVKGLCPAMNPINGSIYLDYLLNVSFSSYSGEVVHFDASGDPPGRYEILNYQKIIAVDGNISYDYITIGHWMTGTLTLNGRDVVPPGMYQGQQVKSVCSEPCKWGQAKKVRGVACCWICSTCLDNEILVENNTDCRACDLGYWPNANKTDCEQIVVDFINWYDTEAIVCVTVSCLGILSTLWVAAIFVRFHDTPVVKASTRELSYIILMGIALAFSANFFIVAKPEQGFCYLTRILPGLSFSLIYGALVTKTNRIARILEGSKRIRTKKPRFMSATAQVIITGIIIGIECAVITAMLLYQPANSKLDYPAPKRVRLVCDTSTLGIIVPLGFDLVLILLCTIYAVKTRNLPENFNEAKFIGFTMYATCVIWSGFFPIYFAGENKEVTLSFSVSLSAAIALLLLFVPKVYVIVWVPEKNTRGAFTTSRDVRCHIGSKSMASGDSIDIKESSTFENLFKTDKGNSKQWKQKSLDEKRLRFVMQRASRSDSASSYINHGVINKHAPLGSCGLMIKESRDSTKTDTTHISPFSSSCSDNRLFAGGDAVRHTLSTESRLSRRQTSFRPDSPAEKKKHRIHNVDNLPDIDQYLLEGVMPSASSDNQRRLQSNFRKSLSSTCVSSGHKTRSIQCQTGEELIQFLLPALRRRYLSKGKHILERSGAMDAGGQESDSSVASGSVFKSSSPRHEDFESHTAQSPNHDSTCLCPADLSDLSPLVLDGRDLSSRHQSLAENSFSCNSTSPHQCDYHVNNYHSSNSDSNNRHHSTPHQHLHIVSSPFCSRCVDRVTPPPTTGKILSLEPSSPSHDGLSSTVPAAGQDLASDNFNLDPNHRYHHHHHHHHHHQLSTKPAPNSIPFQAHVETNVIPTIGNSSSSSSRVKPRLLDNSSNNGTSGSGQASYELPPSPSSLFQPFDSSGSHTTLSSASSSFTLPPFNTSTDSNKSNQSMFSDTVENNITETESTKNIAGKNTNIDNDDEDEQNDDTVNELTPLKGDDCDSDVSPSRVIPLDPLVVEEREIIDFQHYLQCHGVNLDILSEQCSDL